MEKTELLVDWSFDPECYKQNGGGFILALGLGKGWARFMG